MTVNLYERYSGETGCDYEIIGTAIDDKLSWNCHIEKLAKKIAFPNGAKKNVRHPVPPATVLHLIYQALIQPHFDYSCSTVWGTCGVTLQDKLQKLINDGQLPEILGWKKS